MSETQRVIARKFVVGPFQCNCHLLVCPDTFEAAVIDPGDEPTRLLEGVSRLESELGQPIRIKYLLHTHAHLDHIGGSKALKLGRPESPKLSLHSADEAIYLNLKRQGQMFGLNYDDPLPLDVYLQDEQILEVGKLRFSVIHTPGHSPGGVCLRLHEDSDVMTRETVFSGDTLFQNSIGRTDLWGGNMEQLVGSIQQRLMTLDGDTLLCPGHGPDSKVGLEKNQNPFLA
jgi:hydroxyacylglutathione hydrolase